MNKFVKKSGQSSIQYAAIALLVAIGIIVMGPYIVRSWNAYLQGENDAIRDSFSDPLLWTNTNNIIPDCSCEFVPPCDTPPCCAMSPCSPQEEKFEKLCDPLDCEPAEHLCEENSTCCGDWIAHECWPSTDPSCVWGQRGFYRDCGEGVVEWDCQDDQACEFHCAVPQPSCSNMCSNDNTDVPNPNMVWKTNGCTSRKCEAQCTGETIPKGGATYCGCPNPPQPHVQQGCNCVCPDGWHEENGICVEDVTSVHCVLNHYTCHDGYGCQCCGVDGCYGGEVGQGVFNCDDGRAYTVNWCPDVCGPPVCYTHYYTPESLPGGVWFISFWCGPPCYPNGAEIPLSYIYW